MNIMSQKIAITGGIGSGKTFICHLLTAHGIKIYDCDKAAKRLMRENDALKCKLTNLIGDDVYQNGMVVKSVLASFLLKSNENKQAVNNIIHPFVAEDFLSSGYDWLESAILFESGFNHRVHFDHIVCVSAPIQIREKRIMARDNISQMQALQWINCQMPQSDIERQSDFVLLNDEREDLDSQIEKMLEVFQYKI